ncbi:MAG: sigma factor-like helix-turn-helix DNA-binding protein [Patescibacteria group bacterium]
MPNVNYQKICQDLISDLSPRQKDVILERFGLNGGERKTLEAVGESFGVTRERVRQIQDGALEEIKDKTENYPVVFQNLKKYFQSFGDLKKEDAMLQELGEEKWQNQIYFLLTLSNGFVRFGANKDFHPLWAAGAASLERAQKTISLLYQKLEEAKTPLSLKELAKFASQNTPVLESYLEVSKKIQKNSEGVFGLKDWPEINPRGVKDKAYLLFKKTQEPLHFTKVANMIEGSLVQTVHNELIRDPRFILVGRGMYALKEWGYEPGQVKDVISRILKNGKKPLSKEEILGKVLEQRIVKENTVFLNLNNKKYFSRTPQGKYQIQEA